MLLQNWFHSIGIVLFSMNIYIWATQIRLPMQLLGCSIYSQMWARIQALHRSVRWLLWCATKVIKEDLNWNCLHYAASSEHYMHALFALARYSRRTYFHQLEGGPANIIRNFRSTNRLELRINSSYFILKMNSTVNLSDRCDPKP